MYFRILGGDLMGKYESILKRVEAYEKKCQITYAKADGKLFSCLRILLTLSVIYMFAINLLAILSLFIKAKSLNEYTIMTKATLVTVTVVTALLVLFIILTYFKNIWIKLAATIFLFAANIYLIFPFYAISNNGLGFFNLVPVFYWRHLLPFVLILIFALWMIVIIIRQEYMLNFRYKTIINNLYQAYKSDPTTNFDTLSEEEWNDFLKNYDPTNMRK